MGLVEPISRPAAGDPNLSSPQIFAHSPDARQRHTEWVCCTGACCPSRRLRSGAGPRAKARPLLGEQGTCSTLAPLRQVRTICGESSATASSGPKTTGGRRQRSARQHFRNTPRLQYVARWPSFITVSEEALGEDQELRAEARARALDPAGVQQ